MIRLLNIFTLLLHQFSGDDVPPYVIASHRWLNNEASYQDMISKDGIPGKAGLRKVRKFCDFIRSMPGLTQCPWLWIDTVCIDKSSSAELSEAINSMFRWYSNARFCLVYLHDVDYAPEATGRRIRVSDLQKSTWFTRGWTMQELLAPNEAIFLNRNWQVIGHKKSHKTIMSPDQAGPSLNGTLARITGIPKEVLSDYHMSDHTGFHEKVSWLNYRTTTLPEDMAYCMLGILGVFMPQIYGEGRDNAWRRLWDEVAKKGPFLQPYHAQTSFEQPERAFQPRGYGFFEPYERVLQQRGRGYLDQHERTLPQRGEGYAQHSSPYYQPGARIPYYSPKSEQQADSVRAQQQYLPTEQDEKAREMEQLRDLLMKRNKEDREAKNAAAKNREAKEVEMLKELIKKHEEERVIREKMWIEERVKEAAERGVAQAREAMEMEKVEGEATKAAQAKPRQNTERRADTPNLSVEAGATTHLRQLQQLPTDSAPVEVPESSTAEPQNLKVLKKAARNPCNNPSNEPTDTPNHTPKNFSSTAPPIRFKDCLGRKFSFPWKLCSTWDGLESLIKQALVQRLPSDHSWQVNHRLYDLVNEEEKTILPQVWEHVARAGMMIRMRLHEEPPRDYEIGEKSGELCLSWEKDITRTRSRKMRSRELSPLAAWLAGGAGVSSKKS